MSYRGANLDVIFGKYQGDWPIAKRRAAARQECVQAGIGHLCLTVPFARTVRQNSVHCKPDQFRAIHRL